MKRYGVYHTAKSVYSNGQLVSECGAISVGENDYRSIDMTGILPGYEERIVADADDCEKELNCGHPFRRWAKLSRYNREI